MHRAQKESVRSAQAHGWFILGAFSLRHNESQEIHLVGLGFLELLEPRQNVDLEVERPVRDTQVVIVLIQMLVSQPLNVHTW